MFRGVAGKGANKSLHEKTSVLHGKRDNICIIIDSKETSALTVVNTRTKKHNIETDKITQEAVIHLPNGVTINFNRLLAEGYHYDANVAKLLKLVMCKLTAQNSTTGKLNTTVFITFEEYFKLFGLKDTPPMRKKTRRVINKELSVLSGISVHYKNCHFPILSLGYISKNTVIINFNEPFAAYLFHREYPILNKFNIRSLCLRDTPFYVRVKLETNYNIKKNIKQGRHDFISVKALINAVPTIPTHEQVAKSGRHYIRRIQTPLVDALESLVDNGFLKEFTLMHAKKKPLTDAELKELEYSVFIKAYIQYVMPE